MEWLESDVGKAVIKSIEAVTSAFSSMFSQLRSLMEAEMELEVAAVEKSMTGRLRLHRGMPTRRSCLKKRSSRR